MARIAKTKLYQRMIRINIRIKKTLILNKILIINYMMILKMKLLLHLYITKNKKIFKVIKNNRFIKKNNFRNLIIKIFIINKSIIMMLLSIKKPTMNFKTLMTFSNIKNNIKIMMLSILNNTFRRKHIYRINNIHRRNKMSSEFHSNNSNNYRILNMNIKKNFQKHI
jgi:hypothetical protein